MLCVFALGTAPRLLEPDDYAYQASIIALSDGRLTLSGAQYQAVLAQMEHLDQGSPLSAPLPIAGIPQWNQQPDGNWISQKNPGYPFLAVPFYELGIIRLARLCYGLLACLGLFFGARRWLRRRFAGAAAALYCSSGAAALFAWRDYMPTFTDASLLAAGSGAVLWAVLAAEAGPRRRPAVRLLGFVRARRPEGRSVRSRSAGSQICRPVPAGRSPGGRSPGGRGSGGRACWWCSVVGQVKGAAEFLGAMPGLYQAAFGLALDSCCPAEHPQPSGRPELLRQLYRAADPLVRQFLVLHKHD